MRKSSRALTILGIIAIVAAVVLLVLVPFMISGGYFTSPVDVFLRIGNPNIIAAFLGLFQFGGSTIDMGPRIGVIAALAVLVVTWLLHFILLLARRRPGLLVKNLLWLIFGLIVVVLALCAFTKGYFFEGTDLIGYIQGLTVEGGNKVLAIFLIVLPYGLAALGYILYLIAILVSYGDLKKFPGKSRRQKQEEAEARRRAEEAAAENEAALLAAEGRDDYDDLDDMKGGEGQRTSRHNPLFIQNIYYQGNNNGQVTEKPAPAKEEKGLTSDDIRTIVRDEMAQKPLSADDIRGIIKEELKAAIVYEEPVEEEIKPEVKPEPAPLPAPEPEPKPEPEPVVEEKDENKPVTAKELRQIIQEELNDHEHPEDNEPLTDGSARRLIQEELAAYYAPTANEEVEEEDDVLTGDELREIIRQEIAAAKPEEVKEEEVVEEPAPLTAEEIRRIVEEAIAGKPEEGLKADDVRLIVKEELDASKIDDEKKAEAEEAARRNAAAAEARQDREIEELKARQITPEQLRTILAQELDKREVKPAAPVEEKKEEPAPAPVVINITPAPAPEPEPEPEPEPAPEPAPVEEPKAKVVRIPFADRMVVAEQEMKDNYNELKAECLAYGLKSRLSNSGDTFRLHTKAYVKITVAGKGLKLYYALDPLHYEDSPIPVKNVGQKNIYAEIPACFKVKSPLSVKRAKQLIADACAIDGLEKGEVVLRDYSGDLKDYKPQIGGAKDEDDEDDED